MSAFRILKLRLVPRSIFLLGLIIAGAPSALFGDESEQPPIRFLLEWGHRGKADGEFDFPIGIAVDSDGTICVSDFYNARVQRFNPDGKFLSSFGTSPNPGGLAIDREGNLYLTHLYAMKLSVHTRGGRTFAAVGQSGSGRRRFQLSCYAAGLTRLSLWKVMLGTLAGMAPLCFAQAYLADGLLSAFPQLIYPLLAACAIYAVVVLWVLSNQVRKPTDDPMRRD